MEAALLPAAWIQYQYRTIAMSRLETRQRARKHDGPRYRRSKKSDERDDKPKSVKERNEERKKMVKWCYIVLVLCTMPALQNSYSDGDDGRRPDQRPSLSEKEARSGWCAEWSCDGIIPVGKRPIVTGESAGIDMGARGLLGVRGGRRPFVAWCCWL